MKINRYLEELGLAWYNLPGQYDEKLDNNNELCGVAASDIRNREDEEGFCEYEFFNLDYTLSLHIYSKLCYFREHFSSLAVPGCLCGSYDNAVSYEEINERKQAAHNKWISILDKMILAFKLKIKGAREGYEGIDREKIREGMQLFVEYYDCLWY